MIAGILLVLFVCGLAVTSAQSAQPSPNIFAGRPKVGERMTYRMKGINDKWRYQVQASGVVRKDSKENLIESYTWSHLVSNGAAVTLPPSRARFREVLSIDPGRPPSIPNLGAAPPALIGPITDLATFYVDLWLATRLGGKLSHAGDHAHLNLGTPASWADGRRVLTGEDAVDFDFTLLSVNRVAKFATLLVQHVPPAQARVRFPAPWMRKTVLGTPNNWVQVIRENGKFVAAVGVETFDVQMKVSLENGKILSGTLENLVRARERDCRDAALTSWDAPRPLQISRHVEISLQN